MELLFVCLAAHDSEFRRWPDGVDRRICQTFAASPAEPGELPLGFSGDAVVDACVRSRTHYVDITGETAWVRGLIDRYHARCAAEGTRIIPFCGFDSVPSDLGAWLVVRRAWQAFGVPCARASLRPSGLRSTRSLRALRARPARLREFHAQAWRAWRMNTPTLPPCRRSSGQKRQPISWARCRS
jgi:hypothetical protein